MHHQKLLAAVLLATCGLVQAAAPVTAPVTDEDILNDAKTTHQIVTYGLGQQGQRFSPLDQVNTETVVDLVPVWSFSFGGEKQRGQESQPLIHDGVMYVTASYSRAFAIDARTGEELWQYDARLPDGILPCCDVINRGGALHGDLFIFGTLDARLIALDRKTGKVKWNKKIDDYKDGYSYTAAPLIANGLLITGVSGGEFGVIGRVEARDPQTGDLVWIRPVVEGHMGKLRNAAGELVDNGITGGEAGKTWPGDLWKTGGGAPWLGGTYDPETNLLFFGTGNPAPWNSHNRRVEGEPADNLYTAATLALNPDNGEIVWHYQTTPHDGWDYDGVNEFIPFDLEKDGQIIKAGAKADRNGFFYVLDRTNGKLISADPFVTKVTWASHIDLKTGRPVEADNRPGDPAKSADGTKGESVFSAPGFLGGKNWMPMAYSQQTGLFYVPANE